jgi:5,10-methylenetetrahydromethanopterin reductase
VLGLGRGAHTAHALGEPALSTAELEEFVRAVRSLLAGETAQWHGKSLQMGWVREPAPVILAAYGPRTLRMAGRCADGALVSAAVGGPVLREAIKAVADGARDAGRDPAEVVIWVVGRASVGDDRDEALADLKAILAGAGRQLADDDADLDADLRAAVRELKRRYVEADHVVPGGANDALIDELGLLDYLARRFAICGTPDECRLQLQELADLGIECVFLNGAMRNEERMIVSIAEKVGLDYSPARVPAG